MEEMVDIEKIQSKPSKPKPGKFKGWLKKTFRKSNQAESNSKEKCSKATISVTEHHEFPKELVFDFYTVDLNEVIGGGFFSVVHTGFLHLVRVRR